MALTEASEELPTTAVGWFNRGVQFQSADERELAIEAYRLGSQFNDDPIHAGYCCTNLAWLLLDDMEVEEAVKVGWRGLSLDPSSATVMQLLGRALRLSGKTDEAIRFYLAAIEIDPTNTNIWVDIAMMRAAQGRYVEALDVVRDHVGKFTMKSLEYKTLLEVSDICLTALDHPAAPITTGFGCPSREAAAAQWQAFYEDSAAFRKYAPLICLGDSHAAFFSGVHTFQYMWPEPSPQWLPHVTGHYVASALAYSLNRTKTTERGIEKIKAYLRSKELLRGSTLMLSFGEIDLRNHVIGQSISQGRPVSAIVQDCVTGYRNAVETILAEGHRVLIWAPPPSRADDGAYGYMFPTTGTEEDRNAATRDFIDAMRAAMSPLGVPVISIFDEMIGENLRSDPRYFMDSCHLNMAATPLAIQAIRRGLGQD